MARSWLFDGDGRNHSAYLAAFAPQSEGSAVLVSTSPFETFYERRLNEFWSAVDNGKAKGEVCIGLMAGPQYWV